MDQATMQNLLLFGGGQGMVGQGGGGQGMVGQGGQGGGGGEGDQGGNGMMSQDQLARLMVSTC